MPALLMRRSRLSTLLTACWIWEALVTSSVRGVTRLSGCCSALRVPAYTLFAPRRSASATSAWPMPRLAPVINTVLLGMFITFSLFVGLFESGRKRIRLRRLSLPWPYSGLRFYGPFGSSCQIHHSYGEVWG